jgi:hypothetical protein
MPVIPVLRQADAAGSWVPGQPGLQSETLPGPVPGAKDVGLVLRLEE